MKRNINEAFQITATIQDAQDAIDAIHFLPTTLRYGSPISTPALSYLHAYAGSIGVPMNSMELEQKVKVSVRAARKTGGVGNITDLRGVQIITDGNRVSSLKFQ